jgi:hypothetical protein
MNKRARIYCYIVVAVALLVVPQYDWSVLWTLERSDLIGAGALVALALISESLSISGTVGNQRPTSSIAFLPLFACVLLFPQPIAIAAAVLTFTPAQVLIHKRPPLRAAFNAAQMTLSLAIAMALYSLLPGAVPAAQEQQLLTISGFASFAVFAVTFFFVNQVFVSVAMALVGVGRVGTVYSRLASATGVNFIYDILVSPIAAVVALLYSHFGVPGLAIVILPLLIIRHSYESNYKLARANKDLLTVLVKTIETRDPYTSGHSIRVSLLARAIAEDLDLSPSQVDRIETTAMVHDVGKIDAIYAPIIRKEGSLTEAERRVIMTHAEKARNFSRLSSHFLKRSSLAYATITKDLMERAIQRAWVEVRYHFPPGLSCCAIQWTPCSQTDRTERPFRSSRLSASWCAVPALSSTLRSSRSSCARTRWSERLHSSVQMQ